MTREPGHVAIIGGGVIGGMCAWYLSQAGCRVTVVDQGKFGAGCSHGNCGYVSPSHVLPLTRPGAVNDALRSIFQPASPLYVKPRFSPALFKWLWKFLRRCNQRDMLAAAAGRHALLDSSRQLYKQFIEEQEIDCEWQEVGLLFVFAHQHHFEHYEQTDEMTRQHFGVGARRLAGDELIQFEPAIKPGLAGAWLYENDCHLRPDKLMNALRDRLEQDGVEFVEQFEVSRLVQLNGRLESVAGDAGELQADSFVVATGAWTPMLNDQLGCNVPIQPGKGYSLTMPKPSQMPRVPMIFEEDRVAITPMQSKYRIGSTMEFAGYDTSLNRRRLDQLKIVANRYLHDPYCDPVEETWFGWRPMTWDGKPIIDQCPRFNNVLIAAGHNMLGLSMATGTGKLVSEILLGLPEHIDRSHYTLARLR